MIKNEEVFDKAVKEGAKLRTFIQEVLKKKYSSFSKAFSLITGKENRFLKFFTDIIYYKSGGYPTENTLPKHEQYTIDFIEMVKFLDFMGLKQVMLDPLFNKYGITITIEPGRKMQNFNLDGDKIGKANDIIRKATNDKNFKLISRTHYDLIRELLKYTVELQGHICETSDKIKHDLANFVEKTTDITKEDFKDSVKFEVDLGKNRIKEKQVSKIQKSAKSKVGVFQKQIDSLHTAKVAKRKKTG